MLLNTWYTLPDVTEGRGPGLAEWKLIAETRDVVNKELEQLRAAGGIGSGLAAEVDIYCGRELYDVLQKLGDELRFVLITSYARIQLVGETPPPEAQHFTLSSNDELWVAVSRQRVECGHRR